MNATLLQSGSQLRGILLPVLVGSLAIAVAVIGAIVVGNDNGIDDVNSFVETLSGTSGSFLGGLGIDIISASRIPEPAAANSFASDYRRASPAGWERQFDRKNASSGAS